MISCISPGVFASVLEVTERCRAQACTWEIRHDILSLQYIFQHGDNPEAVVFIPCETVVREPRDAADMVAAFVVRCHDYQERTC